MNRKLWLILVIALLNAIGLTIVIPLFPFLIGLYVSADEVALFLGILVSLYAVCKFFMAPIMGALSDHFGRKPILFFSLIATAVGYFTLGIGGALWVLFLGRIIAGLSAGDISALYAYAADCTTGKERTKLYGYLGATNGFGFMIGPAIGGILGIKYISLPFYIAGVISIITAAYIYFFLPETLKKKNQKNLTVSAFNPFSHFKDIFSLIGARRIFILGSYFFIALLFYQSNISVFVKDIFAWGPAQIGAMFALIGLCDIASRAILLPKLLIFPGRAVVIAGLLLMLLGFSSLVLSGYLGGVGLLYISIGLITIGEGLFDPSYNTMLSHSVSENKQGQLQGVNQSLHSVYEIFVPFVTGVIYLYSPIAVYIIATMLILITLLYFCKACKSLNSNELSV